MSAFSQQLLDRVYLKHDNLWNASTKSHPFLAGSAEGTVSKKQFDTWLVQDFIYVKAFKQFISTLVEQAPDAHVQLITGGSDAVDAELLWFQANAEKRGISRAELAEAVPLATTETYKHYLNRIVQSDGAVTKSSPARYVAQIAALYFIEDVYCRAWRGILLKGGEDGLYSVFAKQWGNDAFCQYVEDLKSATRDAITAAVEAGEDAAKLETDISDLLEEILKLEIKFWDMAFEADTSA